MSNIYLLAASLLAQGTILDWQQSQPPSLPDSVSSPLDVRILSAHPTVSVKGSATAAEIQRPEFSRSTSKPVDSARSPLRPTPMPTGHRFNPSTERFATSPQRAIAPPERLNTSSLRAYLPESLPELVPQLLPAIPQPLPVSNPRPSSGSQLYEQRVAALQAGRTYSRLPAHSFQSDWSSASQQPTYEQWIQLLEQEARAMTTGQGNNRLSVIVGDSLSLWLPTEALPNSRFWLNQGISGDTTDGILRRLSAFSQTRPDTIHVMAGINDLRRGATNETVLTNLRQIMKELRQQHPQAQIYVNSILPTRLAAIPSDRIRAINQQLAAIAQTEGVTYVDLQAYFTDPEGNLNRELTTDGIHLNLRGYAVWRWALQAIELA